MFLYKLKFTVVFNELMSISQFVVDAFTAKILNL